MPSSGAAFGRLLQISGLILAPIGLLHYALGREQNLSEPALMTWELGCLAVGAALFILGQRLQGPRP